jgi:cell division inhibitor SulA
MNMLAYNHVTQNDPGLKPLVLTELVQHSSQVNLNTMLLPMLASLSQKESWLVLLDPPKSLTKQVLKGAGIDLNKLWILRRDKRHGLNKLAQRALQAGTCHTLICWHNDPEDDALVRQLKRTQVSSETECLLVRKKI